MQKLIIYLLGILTCLLGMKLAENEKVRKDAIDEDSKDQVIYQY